MGTVPNDSDLLLEASWPLIGADGIRQQVTTITTLYWMQNIQQHPCTSIQTDNNRLIQLMTNNLSAKYWARVYSTVYIYI